MLVPSCAFMQKSWSCFKISSHSSDLWMKTVSFCLYDRFWELVRTRYTMHKQQSQMQRNVLIVDRTQGHKDPVFIAFMLTIKHDGPSDCPWSFLKRHLRNADKYLCLHNGIGEQILHLFTTEKQSRWCTKSQWITYCYFYKCPMNSTFIPSIIKIPFWWWERAAIIRKRNSLLGS